MASVDSVVAHLIAAGDYYAELGKKGVAGTDATLPAPRGSAASMYAHARALLEQRSGKYHPETVAVALKAIDNTMVDFASVGTTWENMARDAYNDGGVDAARIGVAISMRAIAWHRLPPRDKEQMIRWLSRLVELSTRAYGENNAEFTVPALRELVDTADGVRSAVEVLPWRRHLAEAEIAVGASNNATTAACGYMWALSKQNRHGEVVAFMNAAPGRLELLRSGAATEHNRLCVVEEYANSMLELGRGAEVEALLRETIAVMNPGLEKHAVPDVEYNIVYALARMFLDHKDKYTECETLMRWCWVELCHSKGENSKEALSRAHDVAIVMLNQNKLDAESISWMEEVRTRTAKHGFTDMYSYPSLCTGLGSALIELKRVDDARALLDEAIPLFANAPANPGHEKKRASARSLAYAERAWIHHECGEFMRAHELWVKALTHIRLAGYADDSKRVRDLEKDIADVAVKLEEARKKREALAAEVTEVPDGKRVRTVEPLQCVVCLSEDRSVLFTPCQHLITCVACADTVTSCPVCRGAIGGRLKVYMS
jgi:hypothetical protein